MNIFQILTLILLPITLINCTRNKLEEKGFPVSQEMNTDHDEKPDGIIQDSLKLMTRPGGVLLTGISAYRLTTLYKVNINKKTGKTFIGSNYHYCNYEEFSYTNGNQWHYNFMPGIEAVYGYNRVASH